MPAPPSATQRRHLRGDALLVHIKVIHTETHGAYEKLMQQHGIRAKGKHRFRVTTDANHGLPIAPNLLERQFTATEPYKVWVGDMARDIVIDALRMAWFKRRPTRIGRLMLHSDRGSQHASRDFRGALKVHGITALMSRRGDCWDNACSETLAYVSPIQFEQDRFANQPRQANS